MQREKRRARRIGWVGAGRASSCVRTHLPVTSHKASEELDSNNWSPLHHAIDAPSYSWRALEAAKVLVERTPPEVINTPTTGAQPRGYTCLHFACDGSDKMFSRSWLAQSLIDKRADLEARDANGNTPFLLACGTGVTNAVITLIASGADVNALNNRRQGAKQKAMRSSGTTNKALSQASVPSPKHWADSGRTRTGASESRQTRWARNDKWGQSCGGWRETYRWGQSRGGWRGGWREWWQ